MPAEVEKARTLANHIRFTGDRPAEDMDRVSASSDSTWRQPFYEALEVGPELTPQLAAEMKSVCRTLALPPSAVTAFVISSPEAQAACRTISDNLCHVYLASSLIELLNPKELRFVVGHEIGHFLFRHRGGRAREGGYGLEDFVGMRRQELSVDRVGLLACGSLDVAIRTIIKTISGLGDQHLRFDASAFINQIRKARRSGGVAGESSTHPSLIVRARALMWFSMVWDGSADVYGLPRDEVERIDRKIEQDLSTYVDGNLTERAAEVLDDFKLWCILDRICKRGRLSDAERQIVEAQFDSKVKESVERFFRDNLQYRIEERIDTSWHHTRSEVLRQFPQTGQDKLERIERDVDDLFAKGD